MKKHTITIEFSEFDGPDQLNSDDLSLLKRAHKACENAYAPYSLFKVGAAVELNNGAIVIGSNQENMAYPSGLCAERVAVFAAISQYPEATIRRIAISTIGETNTNPLPAAPCGSCRQVMLEYELNQEYEIDVILGHPEKTIRIIRGIKNLLPLHFHEPGLRKDR